MIGMVLAAGAGRRLRPTRTRCPRRWCRSTATGRSSTSRWPTSPRSASTRSVVVVGYRAGRSTSARRELEERHGVQLELVFNDKAEEWNNAYSLWCAREHFAAGRDPRQRRHRAPGLASRETLLAARGDGRILLALDDVKTLGDEEMKVIVRRRPGDADHQADDPATAHGEYIGVTLIEPEAADELADALAGHLRARPAALLRGRLTRSSSTAAATSASRPIGEVDVGRDRQPRATSPRAQEVACRC